MKNIVETAIVSADQMREIESQIFAAGMPVEALMEKAAGLCFNKIISLYPVATTSSVGVLAGPGHNGGDALVIARELYLAGYQVQVYRPFFKLKELTANHANYVASLGITFYEDIQPLSHCQLIIDGLFGFGLTRNLPDNIIKAIELINSWSQPVVSIDLPSGIHTDTGVVMGNSIKATHTLCLGLWKRAFFQDHALEYLGQSSRIDFGLLRHHIWSVLPQPIALKQITKTIALSFLPLPRPAITYKYRQGHLLLICGSRTYAGAAILSALGARASGVGMLSVAVPESLKPMLTSHLPEALIVDCPENKTGAIASLPFSNTDLSKFDVVACGPGLTIGAASVVNTLLQSDCCLVLDADGLNILAEHNVGEVLNARTAPTVLTPHLGEFKRLFPEVSDLEDRINAVQTAAQKSSAIVVLKGARTAIANPQGLTWLVAQSTPALARGGSGDVLTGLTAGLAAQSNQTEDSMFNAVAAAAWWHAQAGIKAAQERTELGVDAKTLAEYLTPTINQLWNE
ncbi:bifunctional ADP-dependent NAD(P)H-hydrate dehydratase/NAD(P)H-hydrate epimerase [Pleurocapsa sp. CCALA 161]|uniref:NAD(P)H-hydrate dehydratase n=1 Tax=Pleurocapsa sp. CCALA 161 TaxID=2107688 RepID=UPI000D0763BD|nr:NAD(P)H-hydrate dehydratase [Pleurocapsa sp. CCALA 161]PSB11861.1 bifunctional ADP-dependent NAD(P)H-hydrate dehydratase/NAD(P)H-hydrate epimerase [Pleurocapsa sp. CCALA 161]